MSRRPRVAGTARRPHPQAPTSVRACPAVLPSPFPGKPPLAHCAIDDGHHAAHTDMRSHTWTNRTPGARHDVTAAERRRAQ